MTVKELIVELLKEPMDSEVCVSDDTKHQTSDGKVVDGYVYDIEDVTEFDSGIVCINIHNWRDAIKMESRE